MRTSAAAGAETGCESPTLLPRKRRGFPGVLPPCNSCVIPAAPRGSAWHPASAGIPGNFRLKPGLRAALTSRRPSACGIVKEYRQTTAPVDKRLHGTQGAGGNSFGFGQPASGRDCAPGRVPAPFARRRGPPPGTPRRQSSDRCQSRGRMPATCFDSQSRAIASQSANRRRLRLFTRSIVATTVASLET